MRVGVVGCGYWGSKHVRVLHSSRDVEGVVAVDVRRERTDPLARSFSARAFSTLEAAIDHVDAVIIATPPSTHFELAQQAIAAGKHVLVEKPLCTTTGDARRLISEADAADVTLMVGHTFEYNAGVWKLQELVSSGELGNIYYLDTSRLNLGLYQSDVDVIWDLAPHDVSIINYVLGATPTSVEAWASSHAHRTLADVAYLRLEYGTIDVTAQVHVSWLYPSKVRQVTAVGSRKMAVYDDLATEERVRIFDKGVEWTQEEPALQNIPMSYRYGDITSPFLSFEEPLAVQDRHFIECARTGKQPSSDGENGLAVVQVLEAAALSVRERTRVPLQEVDVFRLSEEMVDLRAYSPRSS